MGSGQRAEGSRQRAEGSRQRAEVAVGSGQRSQWAEVAVGCDGPSGQWAEVAVGCDGPSGQWAEVAVGCDGPKKAQRKERIFISRRGAKFAKIDGALRFCGENGMVYEDEMSVRLADLVRDEREIVVDVGGETLTVVYRPSSITPETQDLFYERIEKNRTGTALAEILSQRLVSWDLVGEDGVVIEISADMLRKIPVDVLAFVSNAVIADMEANPEDRKNFAGGSQATKSIRRRSGTR